MLRFEKIVLLLIIPLLWNILSVFYLYRKARKGILSPLRFAFGFALGLSIVISTMLFFLIVNTIGIDIRNIGLVLLVFLMHFFIGFPVVYFLTKYLIIKIFPNWSSQINKP
jgi:hypothetical protein